MTPATTVLLELLDQLRKLWAKSSFEDRATFLGEIHGILPIRNTAIEKGRVS